MSPQSQLPESPWGGKHDRQCKPCAEIEHEAEKTESLAAMPKEQDEIDYRLEDNPRCPYCDLQFEAEREEIDGMVNREQERECERCDNTFTIEAEISVTYSTARIKG
ncbi:hypothetical protein [Halomonas sp. AOP43-D1-4]|uniref:hypothetical protein n=1 Tax=Halomonas sp. AOP43-D1-4 TaxID=3457658 RepID=UPI004034F6C4